MKLTVKFLQQKSASDANRLLTKTLDDDNCRRYAIFAAQQVLKNYTRQYPDDMRPQTAIDAAAKYLQTHSEEDRAAARAAAWAAGAAAGAAAEAAAEAAAWAAAGAAARAAGSAEGEKMYRAIIAHGVDLLNQQKAAACRKHRKN
jgi:hypothetical protein